MFRDTVRSFAALPRGRFWTSGTARILSPSSAEEGVKPYHVVVQKSDKCTSFPGHMGGSS